MGDYYLAVVVSKNHAVELYQLLARRGYNFELVSTPCQISSGCSYSIKFKELHSAKAIYEVANNSKKPIKDIYRVYKDGSKKTLEKLNYFSV